MTAPIWTHTEKQFIIKNYESMTAAEIGEILNRTPDAVMRQAARIGIKKNQPRTEWTTGELKILEQMIIDRSTIDEIDVILERHDKTGIIARSSDLEKIQSTS